MQLELNLKSVLKVANPIMLGGFVQFILTFVDTAFLGHIGALQLNAAGNAGLIYITMFLVGQGLSEALQILTARRLGTGEYSALKNLFWNAFFLLLFVSLFSFIVVGVFPGAYLDYLISDPVLSDRMTGFLNIRAFGYFFAMSQLALTGYYSGAAQTKILAISTSILAGVNLLFDYLLIYGIGFFPEMGLNGAALASVIAEAAALIYCILYLRRDKRSFVLIRWQGFQLIKAEIKNLWRLGAPIMGQRFLAMTSWTIFFFLIEKMGRHPLAVSQIIRSLYFLAFIPIMGFGTTAKTYVSYYMAKEDYGMVLKSIKYLCWISVGMLVLMVHGYLLYPAFIISIITDSEALISGAIPILQLVFFQAQIFILASVVFNAIAGVGDTRMAFIIENLCIAVYLIFTYYVIIINPQSIFVVWCSEFVYFSSLLICSVLFFKFRPWRNIKI